MPIPDWIRSLRERVGHDLLMAVAVNAVVFDQEGRVLLQKRSDDARWGPPGGILEPGESVLDAVVRETKEETGAEIAIERLSGIYSSEGHTYPNGDQMSFLTITFRCRYLGGALGCTDGEATEARFFPPDALPEGIPPGYARRMRDAMLPEGAIIV